MAAPLGYQNVQIVDLLGAALTDYVSATEDGLLITIGPGITLGRNVFIDAGKVQDSFIDLILTDENDVALDFELVPTLRIPGVSCVLIWSKASVDPTQQLKLYYNNPNETAYQGTTIGSLDLSQDNTASISSRIDLNNGNYLAIDPQSMQTKNGFTFFSYMEEGTTGNPRCYAAKKCEFTKAIVEKVYVFNVAQANETHNQGTMLIADDGAVHLFAASYIGSGGSAPIYRKSATPYSLDFQIVTAGGVIAEGFQNLGMYYLEPIQTPDGDIYVIGRDWQGWMLRSTDQGLTWTATAIATEVDPPTTNDRTYIWPSQDPITGDILFQFGFSDATGGFEAVHYMRMDAVTKVFTAADGTTITLPAVPGDATEIVNTVGFNPGGNGPYLDSTGAPVVAWANLGFVGSEIGVYRWNGLSWDTHVLQTGGAVDEWFGRFWVIDDLSGSGLIHYLLPHRIDPSRVDCEKWTSTSWGGVLTAVPGENLITNQGDCRLIQLPDPNLVTINPRFYLFCDVDNQSSFFMTDLDTPGYTDNWNRNGPSTVGLNGSNKVLVTADGVANQRWLLKAVATTFTTPTLEAQIKYTETQNNEVFFSGFGGHGATQDINAAGADNAIINMGTPGVGTDLNLRTQNRIAGSATTSAVWDGQDVAQPLNEDEIYYFRVDRNGTTLNTSSYDDSNFGTARGSGTDGNGQNTLGFAGIAQATSGVATEGTTYELSQVRFYDRQNAPAYNTWSGEITITTAEITETFEEHVDSINVAIGAGTTAIITETFEEHIDSITAFVGSGAEATITEVFAEHQDSISVLVPFDFPDGAKTIRIKRDN